MDARLQYAAGRKVDSSRAVEWIKQAWTLFNRGAGIWIAIVLIWAIAVVLVELVPLIGQVVNLFTPVILGGVMLACRRLERGEGISLDVLLEGLRSKQQSRLIILGVVNLAGNAAIDALMGGSVFAVIGGGGMGSNGLPMLSLGGILGVLLAAALVVPLTMVLWFSPALIVFHELQPGEAMKESFDGCLRNVWSLTAYSLLALVLLVAGSIPLGLGLLVALPVLLISIYCSYKDIYEG